MHSLVLVAESTERSLCDNVEGGSHVCHCACGFVFCIYMLWVILWLRHWDCFRFRGIPPHIEVNPARGQDVAAA